MLAVVGCVSGNGSTSEQAQVSPEEARRALAIVDEHKSYGRVDDELRWAPSLCRLPMPGVSRPSTSMDAATHGQKLYSVFAKDHAGYPDDSKPGQVVVKESYRAELVTDPSFVYSPESLSQAPTGDDHFYPYAERDGHIYRAAELAGWYILYKVDRSAPNNDEGWVYATVTADRKVTASGRIGSCMGCHETAPHERLFGVPTHYVP
ncbi:MAG TPA: hypothetical protein VKN99_16055 [Polyangia bacterium]|nr:hypothetical protein [Polyangia bacterium]